jgi:Uma2 family endonuclease
MTANPKRKLTAAEYLAIEEAAEFKSEFVNGEMFAMAGASGFHNDIKENLIGEMFGQLKGTSCRSRSSDQRVNISPTGMYAYPDIVIVCGKVETDPLSPTTITNPVVVIEVLSPSTEGYDRNFKFRQYQQSPTLREYVLVSQHAPTVEVYSRQPNNRWMITYFDGLDAIFALESVPVKIPLADVYRNVEFPPAGGER